MPDLVKVLLVDDQVSNLEALQAVLTSGGCELVCAQSANEALLALLEHDFAAIVLDIRMPGTSGLELARLIKARRKTRNIPILFVTAHMLDDRDVHRGYEVGAVDYLTKPLDPQVLRAKIAIFADLYRASHALTVSNQRLQKEMSDRLAAEQALRDANQQLEARVQARTAEVVHAHRVLVANEERLRIALDAGRMGTWELDEASEVCHVDDIQAGLLGLASGTRVVPFDRLIGLSHPDDMDTVRSAIARSLAQSPGEKVDYAFEFRIVREVDRQVRWLLVKGRTLAIPDGPPRRIGVSADLTDRKLAEEALQQADRRKNAFLATLAHELRNPLAPIRNAVEMLRLNGLGERDQRHATDVIDRQTRALARLVDDLLDISRITQNRLELRREPATLAAIVETAVESSRPLIDAGGHTLQVDVPDEHIVLLADVTRLAQVISNLLNNAARYSDRSGSIHIAVRREDQEAVVTVSDKGIGIAPAMLGRVFDMFVQLEHVPERGRGGLGVGLALSRQLVEMHAGRIVARSEGLGRGTQFEIRLPVGEAIAVADRVEAAAPTSSSTPLRLLVVDDNRDSAESLGAILTHIGNDVRLAFDGIAAVELAAQFRPDVVLLDIGLPLRDGYEAARQIRNEPWGREVRLVALTGWGQAQDRRRSREAGFDHHLVKPVDPRSLLELLSGLHERSTPSGTSQAEQPVASRI
jgi:signal transduction histidine kinase